MVSVQDREPIRRAYFIEGMSIRAICRMTTVDVADILSTLEMRQHCEQLAEGWRNAREKHEHRVRT